MEDPIMNQRKQSPRGFIVSRETVEQSEQMAIWSEMMLEMLHAYGPTDQWRELFRDCKQNGFPRSLFDLK